MDKIDDRIKKISLFSTLTVETLAAVQRKAFYQTVQTGEVIFLEGEPCKAVYFILEGKVFVYHTSLDGREQVLVMATSGQSFNIVPPFQAATLNVASARAVTSGTLCGLHLHDFLALLQSHPDFSLALLRDFADRLSHLTGLVNKLALHSVRGRLAQFLLDQADQKQGTRNWTQDEMAEQLGSVRDVIGRTLREFIQLGLIRKERQKMVLLDRNGLEAEAKN